MERRGLALALIICCCFHSSLSMAAGSVVRQGDSLRQMMASRRKPVGFQPAADWGHDLPEAALSATAKNPADFLVEQKGRSMAADKVDKLPGQPDADFDQYSGYITVDAEAGRALFYYFAESPQNTSFKPLVLWLNGGPRCSSLGFGAMAELGPFRPNSDGRSLSRNPFAWNNVANILFLESPAGIGFSYSNTTSDYKVSGDIRTAEDAYVFLVNWLERFPQYKTHDFYITGESYGSHYVPQLAATIIANNKTKHGATINLKGIAVGNAYFEDYLTFGGVFDTNTMAMYEYFWTHAMISDETRSAIITNCKYPNGNVTGACAEAVDQADSERGDFDIYNIYQPRCRPGSLAHTGLAPYYDPCTDNYVGSYLNLEEVQTALHARVPTVWTSCNLSIPWTDSAPTILPTLIHLIDEGIQLWIYSGDVDSIISVTSTRYTVNALKLPIKNPWRAWIVNNEVGGYVVNYKGLTFATVRGAGHEVPSYQPERALVLFTSFLKGGFS